jgi:dTDP-4-dehydrorhamnose reductase
MGIGTLIEPVISPPVKNKVRIPRNTSMSTKLVESKDVKMRTWDEGLIDYLKEMKHI